MGSKSLANWILSKQAHDANTADYSNAYPAPHPGYGQFGFADAKLDLDLEPIVPANPRSELEGEDNTLVLLKAVTELQRVWRGKLGRSRFAWEVKRDKQRRAHEAVERMKRQHEAKEAAAGRLQRCLRGHWGRRRHHKRATEVRVAKQHKAARVLQNLIRGRKGRKVTRLLKYQEPNPEP